MSDRPIHLLFLDLRSLARPTRRSPSSTRWAWATFEFPILRENENTFKENTDILVCPVCCHRGKIKTGFSHCKDFRPHSPVDAHFVLNMAREMCHIDNWCGKNSICICRWRKLRQRSFWKFSWKCGCRAHDYCPEKKHLFKLFIQEFLYKHEVDESFFSEWNHRTPSPQIHLILCMKQIKVMKLM